MACEPSPYQLSAVAPFSPEAARDVVACLDDRCETLPVGARTSAGSAFDVTAKDGKAEVSVALAVLGPVPEEGVFSLTVRDGSGGTLWTAKKTAPLRYYPNGKACDEPSGYYCAAGRVTF